MSDEILFDNFIMTDDLEVAKEFAAASWDIKSNEERAASSAGVFIHRFLTQNNFQKNTQDVEIDLF